MKYRYLGMGLIYPWTIAGSGFSPTIAYAFVYKYPNVGWRGIYYLLLAVNAAALFCWAAFYFPPTFEDKHVNSSKMYWIKNFDYVGTFLFTAGAVVFLLALSWGGGVYPWKSAVSKVLCNCQLGSLIDEFFLFRLSSPQSFSVLQRWASSLCGSYTVGQSNR